MTGPLSLPPASDQAPALPAFLVNVTLNNTGAKIFPRFFRVPTTVNIRRSLTCVLSRVSV